MIVQKNFLGKLKEFGLNSYEAKLWTAILSRGVSTAGELSDIANVPRSRSYDVLESLEKKGFIIMKLGKPIKYIAVPPSEVIERIKTKIKEDAEQQEQNLDTLKSSEVLNELKTLHTQGVSHVDPADLTGMIKGRNNMYNHLHSIIKNAQQSIRIVTTENGFLRKVDYLKNALMKAKERSVEVSIVAPISKPNTKHAKNIEKFANVRNISDLRTRFCVVDSKQVVFMPLDDENTHASYDFSVWSSSEFFALSMHKVFDKIWADAQKIE